MISNSKARTCIGGERGWGQNLSETISQIQTQKNYLIENIKSKLYHQNISAHIMLLLLIQYMQRICKQKQSS
jgi:hypothetical protein